jgi:hypothetical protein
MQLGDDGHKLICLLPYPVSPTLEGRGAAPMLKMAPTTAKLTLLNTISLDSQNPVRIHFY